VDLPGIFGIDGTFDSAPPNLATLTIGWNGSEVDPPQVSPIGEVAPEAYISTKAKRTTIRDGGDLALAKSWERELTAVVPILMYHAIADDGAPEIRPYRVAPAAFSEQMWFLRRHGYHSISMAEWVSCIVASRKVMGRAVIITFDDGYKSFMSNALPILEGTKLRAAMFVPTRKVGGTVDWDVTSGPPLELVSWDDLRVLRDRGIEIGSHTASHADLLKLPDEEIIRDSLEARATLRQHLDREVSHVAFPWGRNDARTRNALACGGYRVGLAASGGLSSLSDDLMKLPRIEIFGGDDIGMFARRLEAKSPLSRAAAAPLSRMRPTPAAGEAGMDKNYVRALATRLSTLIDGLVAHQTELMIAAGPAESVQRNLSALFTMPVTGTTILTVEPYREISPGVHLGFDGTAVVGLTVEPKQDHTVSPETCLNTLEIVFSGQSRWRTLEAACSWTELSFAKNYQLACYAEPDRPVVCRTILRLPLKDGTESDLAMAPFELRPGQRNTNRSGTLDLPDCTKLDASRNPRLLFFFDSDGDLKIRLDYINFYFA